MNFTRLINVNEEVEAILFNILSCPHLRTFFTTQVIYFFTLNNVQIQRLECERSLKKKKKKGNRAYTVNIREAINTINVSSDCRVSPVFGIVKRFPNFSISW